MGSFIGHVAPGFAFLLLGLWHLFNHIKLFSLHPNTYTAPPWFPSPKLKHLELILIMVGSSISIAMELFIGPERHQPLDDDGTIPSNHLHNVEHSSISLTFFIYAGFAIIFDRLQPKARYAMTQILGAIAFAQQLLTFHLHSSDHMGVEGQYHWLLQIIILVSLTTTVLGIGYPKSFTISFVRSASIAFQGVWFVIMGYALWTPEFVAKGCFINFEEGHQVVRCRTEQALHRAKSLVNIQFSWVTAALAVFAMVFYLVVSNKYADKAEQRVYLGLDEEEEEDDLEGQKKLQELHSFIHMGKGMTSIELER